MNRLLIKEKVKKMICSIIKEQEELDTYGEIQDDSNLETIGLSSIDAIDLIVSLESEFDIEISNGDITLSSTIESICNNIEFKINSNIHEKERVKEIEKEIFE